ncbi:M23 family metallopeptidase [Nocardioides sp. Kera G14]|uniref:M23 family metallopeptidase n=1 Tax=Nocardioides sp. Kera G14 TaxID=2884264 RepID=UPI001D10ED13|nr:M23 family metallopeptidase [Nocardioides sp. Kera G14]UDY22801.1 peptidoglycan DD-metalloendopeptidase family protein [Nocardioides sp. Kera G14]
MRSFPRAGRRRLAAASVAALTVSALAVPMLDPAAMPWASADDHSNKLKKKGQAVRQKIATAGADLDESSTELAAASAKLAKANATLATAQGKLAVAKTALAKAETALATAQAEDAKMQAALAAAQAQLAQAKTDLTTGRAAATEQRRKVESTMISQAQGGDPRVLALAALLNAHSPEDIARQEEFNSTVVSSQAAAYDDLKASEVVLTVREQQVKEATAAVAVQRKAAADHLVVVKGLETQAVAARDEVASWVTQAATAQGAANSARAVAARQKAHDVKVLKALKAEQERIKLAILAAKSKDRNRNVGSVDGLFLTPVRDTYVTSPYGWRKHPIYGYWGLHDGDDFHAPCGVPEIAVDSGRVTDEYYSDVWGNRLFLDLGNVNGHNYTAIYNHLSKYVAHKGQVVARGETVGLAGTTGWSTACHLHFTILKDGVAIDPQTVL